MASERYGLMRVTLERDGPAVVVRLIPQGIVETTTVHMAAQAVMDRLKMYRAGAIDVDWRVVP